MADNASHTSNQPVQEANNQHLDADPTSSRPPIPNSSNAAPSNMTPGSASPATPQAPSAYSQPSHPAHPPQAPSGSASASTSSAPDSERKHAGPSAPPKLLSTYLNAHPTHSAGKAIHKTFPQPNPLWRLIRRFKVKHSVIDGLTEKEMERWLGEGAKLRKKAGWKLESEKGQGVVVSELFWKMYISLLPTLERDPLSGLVPPDLLGSTTTMPLSIISLIPDIMQHYRHVIIRAKKEVFLATNYWQPSNSVNTISGALRDLSARVVKEGREKVIVKIMYDRGSWEQLWNAHAPVNPKEWAPLDLPTQEDIPGLDMEVINFHRVLLGTFHAKFLIVDRKVALINSNNIQDRPNLELMTHFEGPVVDAFYEVALHSWYNRLTPPLPCMTTPYQPPVNSHTGEPHYLFQDHNPYFDDIEILKAAKAARILLRRQTRDLDEERFGAEGPGAGERLREAVRKVVDQQRQSLADWKPGENFEARREVAMKELRDFRERWGLGASRSNSHAPSRRQSHNDGMLKSTFKRDEEKTAIMSAASPSAPSEAESSPTMTAAAEMPAKSKTLPTFAGVSHNWDEEAVAPDSAEGGSARPSIDTPSRSRRNSEKHHVAFSPLVTTNIDGSGRFLATDSEGLVDSPISSRGRTDRLASPITKSGLQYTESPATSSLRLPLEHDYATTSPTSPLAHSQPSENQTCPAPSTTNAHGEVLPVTAQLPNEVPIASTSEEQMNEKAEEIVAMKIPPPTREPSVVQPEGTGSKRMFQLSQKFNAGALSEAWATVEDSDELDSFRPHVVHAPHDPFPIAMCCRKPHGFPGHHDIRNPQNAAWLAGFRYATKKVFIQTPTLNARPIVRAIKQTCRRGVEVVLLLDLGFNDKGESIPFQGGTNEEVVDRLYKILRRDKKEQHLKVYWYTGKDQVRPLNAVKKQRNCHIKFAAYDDEVLIIGNGNQDSQSWFHSQEVNVMIDSKQIVSEMMATLLSNQNTLQYGLVDTDGIWRDKDGHTLEHYGATAKGAFRGLSGFIAFAKTI